MQSKVQTRFPLGVWHRQNALGMVLSALRWVWVIAYRFIMDVRSFFEHPGQTLLMALGIWFAFVLIFALPTFWLTKYQLTANEFVLRRGVFRRQLLHISYTNIQTVQRKQWFFMRPFGIESLQVETAAHTGNDPEVKLLAVPAALGDELERRQHARGTADSSEGATSAVNAEEANATKTHADVATDSQYHHTLTLSELIWYALTSLGFIPTFFMGLAMVQYIANGAAAVAEWTDAKMPHLTHVAVQFLNHLHVLGIVLIALLIIAGSVLINTAFEVLRYWHFTVDFTADRIQTKRGFFVTNDVTARVRRIQAVQFKANIIRNLMHRGTAQVVLASAVGKDTDDDDMVLYPMLRREAVWASLHRIVSWLPSVQPTMQRFSTGTFAMVRNAAFMPVVLTAIACYLFKWWGLLGLPVIVLAIVFGLFAARNRGLAISDRVLFISTGSTLVRTDYAVSRNHIQSLEIRQSWWMKKTGLVHLVANVRKGNGNQSIAVRYIPEKTGHNLYVWYLGPGAKM